MRTLVAAIADAIALLEEHGVKPAEIEMTRATYEALRNECMYPTEQKGNTIYGVRIVVKD